ncbi:metal tolerance protein 5-like isoform X2 [Phragmites australis]|uniref:metal tolerance protein 5-like isoform X2 n=1 Tax=Phragmites australis TaxID=29695 RepID=UPI002D77E182|nr:metal tolerance protein 5-like isoform X2 [Phragmites australis]
MAAAAEEEEEEEDEAKTRRKAPPVFSTPPAPLFLSAACERPASPSPRVQARGGGRSPEGMAADGARGGGDGEELLLRAVEDGVGSEGGVGLCVGERPWRLNFDGFRRPEAHQEKPGRGLQDCLGVLEYYQQQWEMLEGFNEMDTLADRGFLPGMSKEERERVARSEAWAILLSNIANMVHFAAKIYASIRSGSLAIIASTLDSLLDLLSGFILWFTTFSMQTPNPYRYPIGKRRMQPLGILVFASVMATLGLQIILECTRSLVSDGGEFRLTKGQEKWVVDSMISVTLLKVLLVIYCRTFTNEIVKAYAQDHFFDVITNVIGLVAALLADYVQGWIDPVGAIIL